MSYRKSLINAGVKELMKFGYQHVNAKNICSDAIYKEFFKEMLSGTLGKYGGVADADIKTLPDELNAAIEGKAK